jgi:putative redox protein
MEMKITTEMVEDEVYISSTKDSRNVTIDMRSADVKKNLSPTELLLSALAGCGAVDIVSMLKKRRKTIDKFTIETNGTRQENTPRWFTKIHCHYKITSADVTEEEFHKTAKLALEKYCSVASSLKSEITFSIEVIRP